MESDSSRPGTPAGRPLSVVTPDRVNRDHSVFSSGGAARDSPIQDKINQFNNMSVIMASKQLERKTADAALKRAVLGREEAEAEVKRYRDETRALRKVVEEGKERERRVGERLEAVMENYGRAKETHAHTQALWEKEIRRARKENFKSQSSVVKLQEELKSARSKVKTIEESLEREKERSRVREQEAFTARYQIVGVQEQLEKALEQIKLVEQERDAFKAAAQNEEVARIAAEGRIPLPKAEEDDDEFASPKKTTNKKRISSARFMVDKNSRVSLSGMEILASEASELEIEELRFQLEAERSRAERAEEVAEFLQFESQMKTCACPKAHDTPKALAAPRAPEQTAQVDEVVEDVDEDVADEEVTEIQHEYVFVDEESADPMKVDQDVPRPRELEVDEVEMVTEAEVTSDSDHDTIIQQEETLAVPEDIPARQSFRKSKPDMLSPQPISRKGPRRSTIFYPKEGIFRTVSEQEAELIEKERRAEELKAQREMELEDDIEEEIVEEDECRSRHFARTPSVEPPSFALLKNERTSLLSLLDAPTSQTQNAPPPMMRSIPTISDVQESQHVKTASVEEEPQYAEASPEEQMYDVVEPETYNNPHASSTYSVSTTTTTVPVRDETEQMSSSFAEKLRTPSSGSNASFDATNPALTPTMTREQALAKIRERRGRAQSAQKATKASTAAAGGVAHKKTESGRVDRRTVSGVGRKPSAKR